MLFQVQIPVFEQLLLDPFARYLLPVVGLHLHPSASMQVAEVATDSFEVLPSPAEHFDHDFRGPAYCARDQFDLGWRQAIAPTRSPPGIAGDVQQRSAMPNLNESSRHVPAPMRPRSLSATPLRGRGVLPPP